MVDVVEFEFAALEAGEFGVVVAELEGIGDVGLLDVGGGTPVTDGVDAPGAEAFVEVLVVAGVVVGLAVFLLEVPVGVGVAAVGSLGGGVPGGVAFGVGGVGMGVEDVDAE